MLRRLSYRHAIALFLSPDKGGGEGGGGTEPETLAEAKAALQQDREKLNAAEAKAATAERELADARAENEKLKGQFDAATQAATTAATERDQARTELTEAKTQIGVITGERDAARKDLATANENVSRLEQLCGVKGIDPKAAVTHQPEGASSKEQQINALREEIAKCEDPKKKFKLAQELRDLRGH